MSMNTLNVIPSSVCLAFQASNWYAGKITLKKKGNRPTTIAVKTWEGTQHRISDVTVLG
jgi:hypothetical protein